MPYSPLISGASLLLALLISCAPAPETADEAAAPVQRVIDRAIRVHGMEDFDNASATFTFRERDYGIDRAGGDYTYTRSFTDSLGRLTVDKLSNDGLERRITDSLVELSPKDSAAYANSVNSVQYFFSLPYGLHDPAVNATLLDSVRIDGALYDRVRITFDQDGGGTDFEDVYHYFFDRNSGELDYLAYTFEADGGGIRFRKAVNQRRIGGVLVQDYINYGLDGDDRDIDNIAARFTRGELPQLSLIENIAVRINDTEG